MSSRAGRGEQGLLADVVKRRNERDEARRALERAQVVLREYQVEFVLVRLRGRLEDPEDFQRFIGIENVVDAEGRIDPLDLELRLTDLLRRRPRLAATPPEDVGSSL